jgi:alanine-glyoxylate transaminase/serine-glyoxylate transaminase/serine-pyruvate transaminase
VNHQIHPPQRLLFGPGPSQVDARVYEAMQQPIVGHLDAYFLSLVEEIHHMLRMIFGTENKLVFVVSGTGSAGMETAVANFVEPGMKVAVLANGYFSDRMTEMAKRHGAKVVRLEKPWGEACGEAEAGEFIRKHKPQVVMYVHAETSTGALQHGKGICAATHDAGGLVIADVVTSLGAMPVRVDETGIDVAYSCSQKGLSCPPGLAPLTLSPRAAATLQDRKTPSPSWYFDLKLLNDYYRGAHRYHHTAPISNFFALHQALSEILEEGIEQRWDRHHWAHTQFVNGIEDLGLRMHVRKEEDRIVNLNTVCVPEGVDDAQVRAVLLQEHGVEIAGGFGPLAGKIFRIGIMGPLATADHVSTLLRLFADALHQAGYTRKAAAAAR